MSTSSHRVYKQTGTRIACRYCFGRPLDGYPRTDATFFRRGSHAINPTGRAGPWSFLAGWQRAAIRLTTPPALAGLGWAVIEHPAWVTATAGTIGAGALTIAACRIYGEVMDWEHRRRYITPLHQVLARALEYEQTDPHAWLTIPRDFASEDTLGVVIRLPQIHITAETQKLIRDIVVSKLGLVSPTESWHPEGNKPYVIFTPAPAPPKSVTWERLQSHIKAAPETAPIIGLGKRGVVVDADLEADSPHILISAGSGGGKSILAKAILAQTMRHGARVVILDYKRISHRWAQGLENVTYCKGVEEIHDALVRLGKEAERRNIIGDSEEGLQEPRIMILAEEMNATIFKLKLYWDEVREKTDPKRSPAVAALCDVLFMGRAIKMNVVAVAQMMTAATLGGPEARENFATRCLARYSVNAWRMLAPEVWPAPRRSRVVGRWQIVKSGQAHEVQVMYLTDAQARELASEGALPRLAVLDHHRPTEQVAQGETVPAGTRVGLRAAVAQLPGASMTLEALRKASQREGFPPQVGADGVEKLYELDALAEWKRRRDAVARVSSSTGAA